MIRDRIVVGLKDASVAQKLQMDHELMLEKAVALARQSETVKTQQLVVRPPAIADSVSIETIKGNRQTYRKKPQKSSGMQRQDNPVCTRCGKSPPHTKEKCPAKDAICRRCSKKGHFQKLCRSKNTSEPTINQIKEEEDAFLGVVSSNKSIDSWMVNLYLNKQSLDFKIDTGADVTVIPTSVYRKSKHGPLKSSSRLLKGADQQPLQVIGSFTGKLSYNNTESCEEIFVIQGLKTPLVGRPAISSLNLVARVTLIQGDQEAITKRVPELFEGFGQMIGQYHIKLQPHTTPFSLMTPRRIAIPLRSRVKEELQRMEKLGVIAKVQQATDWCAGIVVVPKSNGKVRICVDLTKLNASVCRERHILPSVEETLAQLGDAKVFTKLDANSGFWQIKLANESALLTTFITPFGHYCFKRLPFGISSAPEVFQRKMSEILNGLEGVVCLMDDVLVFGRNYEEHNKRLETVLQKLSESKVTLNREKCEFAQPEITFLGQVIDKNGVHPDPQKVEAITKIPVPNNRTEARRFLGMATQLSKFCPQLSEQAKPIRDLLSAKNEWLWGEPQQKSFDSIKMQLSTSPVLALFDPERETIVSSDASSYGLGAVLKQKQPNGEVRPIAYVSRSLTDTEQRYAQLEKEALALTWACERLSNYLVGTKFLIETDHKPLVPMLSTKCLDELPVRIQRFRMRLMRFQFSIVHVPGKELIAADTLSRAPLTQISPADQQLIAESDIYIAAVLQNLPVTDKRLTEIKQAQEQDIVCEAVKQACMQGWPEQSKQKGELKKYASEASHLTIQEGILLYDDRLVIPKSLQQEILLRLHTGHQGIHKCKQRARDSVWWPGIGKEITQLIEKCPMCSVYKQQPSEPLITSTLPLYPWQRIATDMFEWKGHNYLLVVDYYSRFIEIAKLSNTKAGTSSTEVVRHLKSIMARHGIPAELISDNGPQFSADVFTEFTKTYGISHKTSSPRHPQGNGEAERAVKTIKAILNKAEDPYLGLLTYRTTVLQNGYSPSQLLMGRKLRSTVPQLQTHFSPQLPTQTELREKDKSLKHSQKKNFDRRHRVRSLTPLKTGEKVWICDRKETGTVISKESRRSYEVEAMGGRYRRNRKHLIPMNTQELTNGLPDEDTSNNSGAARETLSMLRTKRQSRPPDRLIEHM